MSDTREVRARLTAEMLIHLSRLAQADEGDHALTPAQWTALRFFARANRLSRTPSAFADFHATTRGTASQTVKSLVSAGYLEGRRDQRDGRSVRYEVTPAGRERLESDPLDRLSGAIARLPAGQRTAFVDAVQGLSRDLSDARGRERFGTCSDCAHLVAPEAGVGCGPHCNCLGMALLTEELDRLCVDFEPRKTRRGRADPA